MGTIKDIHDLLAKLITSRNDRKLASEILEIQSLVSTVQAENTAINEKYNESLSANIELKQKLSESEQEKSRLIKTHEKEVSNLKETIKKMKDDDGGGFLYGGVVVHD